MINNLCSMSNSWRWKHFWNIFGNWLLVPRMLHLRYPRYAPGMYTLRHSFGSKFLQEISIHVIFIFCLKFPAANILNLLLPYFLWEAPPPAPSPHLCITASENILPSRNLCFRMSKLQLKVINKNFCYLYNVWVNQIN